MALRLEDEQPKALLVAAGEILGQGSLEKLLSDVGTVIAIDGGLAHLRTVDHSPDLVVGDLDSVSKNDLEWARAAGAEVISMAGQEESDLAKGFEYCSQKGLNLIDVIGIEGGRLAHQFATYAALAEADSSLSITVHLQNATVHRLVVGGSATGGSTQIEPEGEFSIFALQRAQVTISGAKYELAEEWLELDTRGLSNFSNGLVTIEVHSGGPVLLFLNI
jgi:thiamine pyrophosphokinase